MQLTPSSEKVVNLINMKKKTRWLFLQDTLILMHKNQIKIAGMLLFIGIVHLSDNKPKRRKFLY